ncbi:hypothetical protein CHINAEXTREME_19165 [Halobiforma lacisalsi AJ5]|uniref:Uncharacterized protein n=1 Tax=Natronobacterium lacisalsi AJ5 TaxID=358396 RepID=M0LVF6_NATLA|nr:hypothetical protein [Halobiforma lacisalsi]APW99758.1 hypothetical protein CHINAEXTREME_19165 [Halobiforma lacisalsi AJ5]EMA36065.1 hypothetical protein C445_04388 [Halobiforma lacisalsi AJ5]
MSRYRGMDYAALTKTGFLLGIGLLTLGAGGELFGQFVLGGVPGWEDRLFTYAEGLGILVSFVSVWTFGVFLPLTE